MKLRTDKSMVAFNMISYSTLTLFSFLCVIPFWLIISGSFSSETSIIREGYGIIPREFSMNAYEELFRSAKEIKKAYLVTICLTVAGPAIGLFLQTMGAYVLQRKDFKYANKMAFFIYFTTLFSGGLVPWYILMVQYLHLKDSYLAMLIPPLVGSWNIILLKNFMKSIPAEITESAKIDGAGDFLIYRRLILPLSIPGLATIGLFMALGYWNDWYLCNLFITSPEKYNLQCLLYNVLKKAEFLQSSFAGLVSTEHYDPPKETIKLATAVIVTGPIIFLYPFVQKYFVKGLTIGAVKG